ncbi:type II toxin-antitoxin system Phd/YefM family antitoxin [Roseofilum capinflatum]|uniref:Antitoxin n=1 Tax=Roseofilum capinflatum BLCC-M114 TaxID=3022440 RepID=A0ABT7BBP2_9CYAN|nr:type II toxin-antitoxin system Phd/YefM family antitoxin [Roseofilum capinflatum]MDJ1176495.1 type II toxin-antitoxin system Phd/YefM family antitoxin [Roseofilum capinflatum BLCC-M114]
MQLCNHNFAINFFSLTTQQAQQDLDGVIERAIANSEAIVLCNDKGERAVLMSLDEFTSWKETLYLLSNPANAAHLLSSIESAKAGKGIERELIEE